jgi:hypothetical protein
MGRENGTALVVAIMALLVITGLSAAVTLTTSAEARIAANFRVAAEGLYAAEAALDRAADELALVDGWEGVLDGSRRSPFVDGAPNGLRTLADGSTISLDAILNQANCGRVTPCSAADMDAVTTDRPHGVNNPRWQLYVHCPFSTLLPSATVDLSFYVVVLVGDDGGETDGNPMVDGGLPLPPAASNPGRGVLAVRALAFGPAGAEKAIESTVARAIRTVSWVELR